MNEQQAKPQAPFPFKFWAVLIGFGSLQTFVMYFFPIPNVPTPSPLQQIIQISTALIGVAVAIGFWLHRRWGLWLYIALLVFWFIQAVVFMVNEQNTTGSVNFLELRVVTLLMGVLFLFFMYHARHQFK